MPFEKVVDRLLASPAYGQRWARHWLDVARYADYYDADPKTRTASCELTEAWRYRDWVVDAFNRDLPFDQFIVHQIAGDLLPDPDGKEVYPAGLIATTFLSNGVWDRGDADKEKIVSDMVDDQIDTVGKAFLGLTLGCARCHDHKFDPISQQDYYALAGIFYSTHILKDLGAKGAEYVMNRVPLVPKAQVAGQGKPTPADRRNPGKAGRSSRKSRPLQTSRRTGPSSSRSAIAFSEAFPPSRLSQWLCKKEELQADCFPRFRTCRSTTAAVMPSWDRSSRGDCPGSSRAKRNLPSATEADVGNWPAGWRRPRTHSPRE